MRFFFSFSTAANCAAQAVVSQPISSMSVSVDDTSLPFPRQSSLDKSAGMHVEANAGGYSKQPSSGNHEYETLLCLLKLHAHSRPISFS